MREIDYSLILGNIDVMINTLEYDSMRSAGKMKINSSTLLDMIKLKEYYIAAKKQSDKKEA